MPRGPRDCEAVLPSTRRIENALAGSINQYAVASRGVQSFPRLIIFYRFQLVDYMRGRAVQGAGGRWGVTGGPGSSDRGGGASESI